MEGYSQSVDLYKNSLNSAGTATEKFGLYMQGNEAAVNKLKATWESLWMSTFNSDAIKLFVGALTGLASVLKTIGDTFGSLPTVFAAAGIAILAFNGGIKSIMINGSLLLTTFKGLVPGVVRLDAALAGATLRARLFGATSRGLTAVVGGLKTALVSTGTFLAGAIFPLAAFAAVGFAISKITDSLAKQRQEEEQLKRQQESIITTYKKRKDEVSTMVAEYDRLSKVKKESGSLSNDNEEKYVELQNQLSKILPQVKIGVDAKGNAIIQSSDALKDQIKLLEEQIRLEKEQQRLEAPKSIKGNASKADDLKEELAYRKEVADQYKKDIATLEKEKASAGEIAEVRRLEGEWRLKQKNTEAQIYALTSKNSSSIKTFFDGMKLDATVTDKMSSMLSSIDFSGKDMGEIEGTIGSIVKAVGALNVAMKSGDSSSIKNAESSLGSLLNAYGNGKLNVKDFTAALQESNTAEANSANSTSQLSKSANDLNVVLKDLNDNHSLSAASIASISNQYPELIDYLGNEEVLRGKLEEIVNAETDANNNNTSAKLENANAASILFGVTSDQIVQMENAVAVVQMLSDVENLSAQQKGILAQATAILAAQYPNLNGAISENIDWISTQVGYMSALGNVSGSSAATMIKNQNSTTKATIAQINQRILGYRKEAQALAALVNNIEAAYETDGMSGAKSAVYHKATKRLEQINAELASANASLVEVTYGSGVKTGQIKVDKPSGSKTNSGAGKGTKTGSGKSNSNDNKIEKVIDPYEDKLHDYDEDIKKSEAIQKRYKEGSKEWIAEEKKQIGYIEKKRTTVIAEQKALEKLLKSGKLDKDQKKEVNNRLKELKTSQEEYTTAIKENTQAIMQNLINAKIEATESYYDKQIAALQKKLDLMDEEEKKQDRINRKKELEDQLAKAKSDTRYEYVDKNGKVQLTYDKAEVARIEKEKKDQEAEWKKEDERAALEKKIADAEVNRDKAIAALNKLQETYFKKSIKNADDMKKVLSQLSKDLDKIYKNGTVNVKKHHKGGIVGQNSSSSRLSSLVNEMFNVKPNEEIVKALKGEVMIPPVNIPNGIANMQAALKGSSTSQAVIYNYNMSNFTIQADNAQELFKNLDMHVRMNKH